MSKISVAFELAILVGMSRVINFIYSQSHSNPSISRLQDCRTVASHFTLMKHISSLLSTSASWYIKFLSVWIGQEETSRIIDQHIMFHYEQGKTDSDPRKSRNFLDQQHIGYLFYPLVKLLCWRLEIEAHEACIVGSVIK